MSRVFLMMFLAGLSALIAWAITEPLAPARVPLDEFTEANRELSRQWRIYERVFSLVLGAFIGMTIGGVTGHFQGSASHLRRGIIIGLIVGALGGTIGLTLGGSFAFLVFGEQVFKNPATPLPVQIMARMFVFVFFGGLIGLVQGIPVKSFKRCLQGLVGGLIGGAAGGIAFDVIGMIVGTMMVATQVSSVDPLSGGLSNQEIGTLPRALASVVIGMAIGLFVGLVERLSRRAWLRLELGRNEGREWTVDAAQTFIGRSENAHVPLFGDPNIAPMHACIYRTGGAYQLVDGGAPMGVGVNGVRVREAVLHSGDVVQVGGYNLRFVLKDARHQAPVSVDAARSQSPVAMGIDPHTQAPSSAWSVDPMRQAPFPAGPAPAVALVAMDGPLGGQRFGIGSSELVAGREAPGIPLAFDSSASRVHCAFVASASGLLVRDLGSTNGTIVNGARVQEMMLRSGDLVRIGQTTFRVE